MLRLKRLLPELEKKTHPHAGTDSVFVGMLTSGEIFNQAPTECQLSGTRRWVTPGDGDAALGELDELLAEVAQETGTSIELKPMLSGDAFRLNEDDPLVRSFLNSYGAVSGGRTLEFGKKPFVDDGNAFYAMRGIAALTHGPAATGAHTLDEKVPIDELVRVAQTYLLTAVDFCPYAK